jgi:hypothetical protein
MIAGVFFLERKMKQCIIQIHAGRHEDGSVGSLVLYGMIDDDRSAFSMAKYIRSLLRVACEIENKDSRRHDSPGEYLRRLLTVTWDEFGSPRVNDLLDQARLYANPYPRVPITRVYQLGAMDAFAEDNPNEADGSMFDEGVQDLEQADIEVFEVFDLSRS